MTRTWYTQRQWDRVVGWDKVPKEYNNPEGDEEEMAEHENDITQSSRRRARIAAWVARSNDITLESEEDEQENKSVDENTDD